MLLYSLFVLISLTSCRIVHPPGNRQLVFKGNHQQIADTDSEKIAPGVGFDLTAFYGTASVSYANGTRLPIAKVDTMARSRELWLRLALESSKHVAIEDEIKDRPRQDLRSLRKRLGLPSSSDVGIIAEMIIALRDRTSTFLGHNMNFVVVTIPKLPGVYSEDIRDAIEYAGLRSTKVWFFDHLSYEATASYAGYRLGLYESWTQPEICLRETNACPREEVFTVLYTREALTLATSYVKAAYYLFPPDYFNRLDFELGSGKLESLSAAGEERYWEALRRRLWIFLSGRSGLVSMGSW
ncbi:hypothetical protein KVT40_002740 [Elsinoe batatas]|uniref:Uncharacterized protein n=1 Tax=Elsinoe batatas TaxID=2601811 RepID=A0A8K0PE65_9PEZI|nr:hypothetical protein KVT40_002740 [Elsinoe batatas]